MINATFCNFDQRLTCIYKSLDPVNGVKLISSVSRLFVLFRVYFLSLSTIYNPVCSLIHSSQGVHIWYANLRSRFFRGHHLNAAYPPFHPPPPLHRVVIGHVPCRQKLKSKSSPSEDVASYLDNQSGTCVGCVTLGTRLGYPLLLCYGKRA